MEELEGNKDEVRGYKAVVEKGAWSSFKTVKKNANNIEDARGRPKEDKHAQNGRSEETRERRKRFFDWSPLGERHDFEFEVVKRRELEESRWNSLIEGEHMFVGSSRDREQQGEKAQSLPQLGW